MQDIDITQRSLDVKGISRQQVLSPFKPAMNNQSAQLEPLKHVTSDQKSMNSNDILRTIQTSHLTDQILTSKDINETDRINIDIQDQLRG